MQKTLKVNPRTAKAYYLMRKVHVAGYVFDDPMVECDGLFFFFSSRRRHTRSLCDWSSDVCSSDLAWGCPFSTALRPSLRAEIRCGACSSSRHRASPGEIGRAPCRESVQISGVD